MMNDLKKEKKYESIGPTAWRISYFRTLTDIKYAKEIFDELNTVVAPSDPVQIEYMESAKTSILAPQFEARYKLINRLLRKHQTNQILEIASGLTPRGLEMTEENPDLQYVEFDLPYMAEYKREMLKSLSAKDKIKTQDNLYIVDGDALDEESLFKATKYFGNGPISVVNEGLLRYLNFDQKEIVSKNILMLLKKFGGTWITSDITLKKVLSCEQERVDNRRRVLALSGIDVEKNCFDSEQAAHDFFEKNGFNVESHSFLEVMDELVSPKNLGLETKTVEDMIRHAVVFVMSPK
jgi:O-methyltransferase involved in polyketide biosynthesis